MSSQSPNDRSSYDSYAEHVNASYPDFLRRLGLENVAVHATAARITDSAGQSYIDCTAGYGLFNLGHNPPKVVEALIEQLRSTGAQTKPLISAIQAEFAERLVQATPEGLDCVFLCNSGSEAVDNALKLARLTSRRKKIVAANGSFHGYTYGALSVTGIKKFRMPFEPMVPDIEFIDYGDLQAANQVIDKHTAAVILEPMQHEAGVSIPAGGYFQGIRDICDKHGTLLIIDEVKTGFGKTGSLFATQMLGVRPDIMVLGKSLGGGLIPSGALLASKELWKRFGLSFPMSASSYAGNALACRAGLAVLDTFNETDLIPACVQKGLLLETKFTKLLSDYSDILVRATGQGLLYSLKLSNPKLTFELSKQLIKQGILAMPAFGNNAELMIEPPLVISEAELRQVTHGISTALGKI